MKASRFCSFITHCPGMVKQQQPAPGPQAGREELGLQRPSQEIAEIAKIFVVGKDSL